MDLSKSIPNESFRFIIAINEDYDDLSDLLIRKAGPFGNFYGQTLTANDFNCKQLYVNGKVYSKDDKIPSLLEILNE
jgi:hypothetical protein